MHTINTTTCPVAVRSAILQIGQGIATLRFQTVLVVLVSARLTTTNGSSGLDNHNMSKSGTACLEFPSFFGGGQTQNASTPSSLSLIPDQTSLLLSSMNSSSAAKLNNNNSELRDSITFSELFGAFSLRDVAALQNVAFVIDCCEDVRVGNNYYTSRITESSTMFSLQSLRAAAAGSAFFIRVVPRTVVRNNQNLGNGWNVYVEGDDHEDNMLQREDEENFSPSKAEEPIEKVISKNILHMTATGSDKAPLKFPVKQVFDCATMLGESCNRNFCVSSEGMCGEMPILFPKQ